MRTTKRRSTQKAGLLALLLAFVNLGCFSRSLAIRSYFALDASPGPKAGSTYEGLLRVRNMDPASAYDKFQIVVRSSPYELRYDQTKLWAVKPGQMMSDLLAKSLDEAGCFSSVTRVLGDERPKYGMDGELHAIEIYDSHDIWFAHLAFSIRMFGFSDGVVYWNYRFDQRKQVPSKTFSQTARALSELLDGALSEIVLSLCKGLETRPAEDSESLQEEPKQIIVPESERMESGPPAP